MPAYYKGQPVFGIMGSGGNEFIKWRVGCYPASDSKNLLLYHNGYYYFGIGDYLYRTKDFAQSEFLTVPGSYGFTCMETDREQLIAKRAQSNILYLSTDGETWTNQSQTGFNSGVNSIITFKGKYIGWQANYNRIYYTEVLPTWNQKICPSRLSSHYIADNEIMLIADYNASSKPIMWTENGEDFTQINDIGESMQVYSMAKLNGTYFAVTGNYKILKSTDGKQWEISATLPDYYSHMVAFKDRLIAIPANGIVYDGNNPVAKPALYSKDGETWEELEGSYGYGMQSSTVINGKLFCTQPDSYCHLLIGE